MASDSSERIYLTGFMASGKTTVGAVLAARLGWEFIDLDRVIEARSGQNIPELFSRGEDLFRMLEYEAVCAISSMPQRVIALGGGALDTPGSQDYVQSKGVLVYLEVDPDTIERRLHTSDIARPMMAGLEGVSLRERIESLLEKRRPNYERASVIVQAGDDRSVDATVKDILNALPFG
jgi:shikimate kinase